MVDIKRPRKPHRRCHAERDAEIYDRVFVSRKMTEKDAAAEYGLTQSRISEILTEEYARQTGAARKRVVHQHETKSRNAEIYRRVVELGELTGMAAAIEYGITRQRVSQILDAVHLERYGVKRPALR